MDRDIQISKTLSYVLRHGISELNLNINEKGQVNINDLLSLNIIKNLKITESDIIHIVNSCSKQRFNLEIINGVKYIGANQGHSKNIGKNINNDELMELLNKPLPLCIHGTYLKYMDSINSSGLKNMSRSHIHFAIDYPKSNNVISGARNNCDVFIEIDMKKAMNDGIKFYRSKNGVILSEGINGVIDPKYFINIKTNI